MKRDAKQVNSRGVALALGGGAALMLVATQLVAKPNTPSTTGAVVRPATRPAETAPATTRVVANSLADSPIVGAAPIRELFRPLIAPPKSASKTPLLPVGPKLPPATPVKPVAAAPTPAPTSVTPAPAAPPAGPSTGEIQMLGVVEFSDGVKALLKKTSSGESRYFAKGDDAFGFTVGDISATDVYLAHAGKSDKIAMSSATPIETSSGTSIVSNGNFGGGSSFGGSSGFRERSSRSGSSSDRGSRGSSDRGNRGGGDTTARSESGFSTSQIMSLPTWAERLKKLDEIKAQLEPEKYDRLKKFMEGRAAAEKSK